MTEERERKESTQNVQSVDMDCLRSIEAKYKALAERQRRDQRAMKQMEAALKAKGAEVYKLKSQLITKEHTPSLSANGLRHRNSAHHVLHGITKLKGEIAQTKLDVQRQLEAFTSQNNIDESVMDI